jgi:tetratricopeptide (TPR) repeat protein
VAIDRGNVFLDLKKFDHTIASNDKAIENDPKNGLSWQNESAALFSQQKYDEATKCYDKANEIDPKNTATWSGRGSTLIEKGEYQGVAAALDTARAMNPNDTSILRPCRVSTQTARLITKKRWSCFV